MCVRVCVCMCVCVFECIRAFVYLHIRSCKHKCLNGFEAVLEYIYIYRYIYICVCVCVCV